MGQGGAAPGGAPYPSARPTPTTSSAGEGSRQRTAEPRLENTYTQRPVAKFHSAIRPSSAPTTTCGVQHRGQAQRGQRGGGPAESKQRGRSSSALFSATSSNAAHSGVRTAPAPPAPCSGRCLGAPCRWAQSQGAAGWRTRARRRSRCARPAGGGRAPGSAGGRPAPAAGARRRRGPGTRRCGARGGTQPPRRVRPQKSAPLCRPARRWRTAAAGGGRQVRAEDMRYEMESVMSAVAEAAVARSRCPAADIDRAHLRPHQHEGELGGVIHLRRRCRQAQQRLAGVSRRACIAARLPSLAHGDSDERLAPQALHGKWHIVRDEPQGPERGEERHLYPMAAATRPPLVKLFIGSGA